MDAGVHRMLNLYRLALFASLTVLGTFCCIPLPFAWWGETVLNRPEVLFSLGNMHLGLAQTSAQLLAVCLAATTLTPVTAALSQLAYLFLGLSGHSVFGGGGGWAYAQASTFPYLLMFPVGAFLGARLGRGKGFAGRLRSLVLALVMIWTIGSASELAAASALSQMDAWWRLGQTHVQELPGLVGYLFALAAIGAVYDRLVALLRSSAPAARPVPRTATGSAPPLPEKAALPVPVTERPMVPPMPKRTELEGSRRPPEDTTQRKLIEGPPRRTSLPGTPDDPAPR
jgi:biotin transporter BioY